MAFLYGSGGEVAQDNLFEGDWSSVSNLGYSLFLDSTVSHTGSGSWRCDSVPDGIGGWLRPAYPHGFDPALYNKTSGKIWATVAVRKNSSPNQIVQLIGFESTGGFRRIAMTALDSIVLCNETWTILAQSATGLFGNNTWYALQAEIDMGTNAWKVYFVSAANEMSSPVITYNDAALGTLRRIDFGTLSQKGAHPSTTVWQDDFFINDESGDELAYRPTYLMRAYPIGPTSNGDYSDWLNDFTQVDEVSPTAPPDTNDYIQSGVGGNEVNETHGFSNPVGTDSIHGVCFFVCAATVSGTQGTLYAMERLSPTDRVTALYDPHPIPRTAPCPQMRDPAGNVWTQANINLAQWGVRRGAVASGARNIRAYATWGYVFRSPQAVEEPPPTPSARHYGWTY